MIIPGDKKDSMSIGSMETLIFVQDFGEAFLAFSKDCIVGHLVNSAVVEDPKQLAALKFYLKFLLLSILEVEGDIEFFPFLNDKSLIHLPVELFMSHIKRCLDCL